MKIQGEGDLEKSKKRIVGLGRSVKDDVDSYWEAIAGMIDDISIEIREIKELVSKLY